MDKKKFEDLLQAYVRGDASKEEAYIIDRWYELSGQEPVDAPPLSERQQQALGRRLLQASLSRKQSSKRYKFYPWQAAAIALLVFSVLYSWVGHRKKASLDKKPTELLFSTDARQLKKIILPDSSTIWLNAQSTLRLQAGYGTTHRQLSLHGEAFFEVSKDEQHPMQLDADGVQIQVLGTSFNVNAYKTLPEIKIALRTGKIQVKTGQGPNYLQLKPGDKLIYNKAQKRHQVSEIGHSTEPEWTAGKNLLEQASFNELAQVFRNLYGMSLETDIARIKNQKFDLTLRSTQTIDEALNTICTILNARYRKEGNEKIILF